MEILSREREYRHGLSRNPVIAAISSEHNHVMSSRSIEIKLQDVYIMYNAGQSVTSPCTQRSLKQSLKFEGSQEIVFEPEKDFLSYIAQNPSLTPYSESERTKGLNSKLLVEIRKCTVLHVKDSVKRL